MIRKSFVLGIVAGLAACGSQSTQDSAEDAAAAATDEPTVSEAPADEAAAAGAESAGGSQMAATKGQLLVATKTTECVEVGENASDYPWTIGQGSHVKFVANADGGKTRVTVASGDECLIDSDAIAAE